MQKCNITQKNCLFVLFILIFIINFNYLNCQKSKNSDSYAFLNVRSLLNPKNEAKFCVNYQQYVTRQLPKTVEDAKPLHLAWLNNNPKQIEACDLNLKIFNNNELVPALYRTNSSNSSCKNLANQDRENLIKYQTNLMLKQNISEILFLMKKGEYNFYGFRDFLFLSFYNPEIDDKYPGNVFYIYYDLFYDNLLQFISSTNETNFEIRFYRPKSVSFYDLNLVVIWLLAVGSVFFGGLWSAYDVKLQSLQDEIIRSLIPISRPNSTNNTIIVIPNQLDVNINNQINNSIETINEEIKSNDDSLARMNAWFHFGYVVYIIVIVGAVLVLSFFFRNYAIVFFNVLLVIIGTISVYKCVYGLIELFFVYLLKKTFDFTLFRLSKLLRIEKYITRDNEVKETIFYFLCRKIASSSIYKKKMFFFSTIIFFASGALCLTWYIYRKDPYAFILLNFINFCICIYGIRASKIRSLRFLTFLLCGMFAYDFFMVFGTRLLTSSGCSVMAQVATGVDCTPTQNANNKSLLYPISPNQLQLPERIPVVFAVPKLNNPISECIDLDVEVGFNLTILGLGDVVIIGYLISYCFYIDIKNRNKFYSFGLISVLSYGLGLIFTFSALFLMNTAQPALIYLVPLTLLPTVFWAWRQGILREIWYGGSQLTVNT